MPKWNGGIIGAANNPTQSSAKGIWSLSEATKAIRAGLWPPSNAGADPYFENVTMLLSADGTNGAQNNTFLDSSTNAFTITRNGNTTQGTFTPFSKPDGRWSNYFDGTGDYLSVPRSTDFLPGANVDFTFEVWFYPTATPGGATNVVGLGEFGTNADWHMGVNSSLQLTFYLQSTTTTYTNSTQALTLNQWNHLAISRSGTGSNNLKLFVNGVSQSFSVNNTLVGTGTNPLTIGADNGGDEGNITGYLSNLRLVNGQGLYTANFTPTTSPLTTTSQSVTASNVELLALQSNRFIDNSSNAATITRNGDVSVQTFSPFPTLTAYDAGTNGGSGYFDGSGDYLSAAYNSAYAFTGDFTIEFWVNWSAHGSYGGLVTNMQSSGATPAGWQIVFNSTADTVNFDIASNYPLMTSSSSLIKNAWTHVAVVRSGSATDNIKMYFNGVQVAQATSTSTIDSTNASLYVGADRAATGLTTGYFSGIRILKGTAQYTAAFTPPTAPPTAITNTSILLNFTNGGIVDAAMSNDLETVGNAQISTTQSKFGGSSMYFDGSGDYLVVPHSATSGFRTGNYTVEFWLYTTSSTQYATISTRAVNSSSWEYSLMINQASSTSGDVALYDGSYSTSTPLVVTSGVNIRDGSWHHVALVRSGNTFYIFVDGTQRATATQTFTPTILTTPTLIGADTVFTGRDFAGYIDDFRITRGYARYTANFTAPVGPFVGFGD